MKGLPKMKGIIKKKQQNNLPDTSIEEGRHFNLENKTASKDNLPTNLPQTSESLQRLEENLKDFTSVFTPMLFVRYPFFVSTSTKKRKREISYIGKESNGTKIADVRWEIEARDYLSGEMEYKIWYWLLYKLSKIPKPLPLNFYLPYTLSEIARFWKLNKGKRTFDLIRKAIKNLRTTNIYYWKQLEKEKPADLSFTILSERLGKGKKIDDSLMNKNILFLSLPLIIVMNEYQLKPLNGETLKYLIDKNIISARLYEILGWRFYTSHRNKQLKFLYKDLINRIGLSEKKYLSGAKRQFDNAIKYLLETKIIKEKPKWKRIQDTWNLTFNIDEGLKLEAFEFSKRIEDQNNNKQLKVYKPHPDLDDAMNLILETVEVKGNDKEVYRRLVNQILNRYPRGLDNVYMAISSLNQESIKSDIKNPAGYLYKLLQNFIKG